MSTCNSDNVFINCPFDNEYFRLLRPLLFAIVCLNKKPLISETKDSSQYRLEQITSLMERAQYSIHDLSCINSENPRFNMPFELGIDFGLKRSEQYKNKKILILEKEKYSLKSIISDISGNDTKHHSNQPKEIVKCIRDWFVTTIEATDITYTELYDAYNSFIELFEKKLAGKGVPIPITIDTIPLSELIDNMKKFIDKAKI